MRLNMHTAQRRIDGAAAPTVYVPHSQYVADSMTIFIRTAGDPTAIASGRHDIGASNGAARS